MFTDGVSIKTGKENMDLRAIHQFLSLESYWAKSISFDFIENSLANSFCVGAFVNEAQIGFGRVITDYYTFGWLADFYVLQDFRGRGISKKMIARIFEEPWIKRLRRIMLNTSDAHGLYQQFGFSALKDCTRVMEIHSPNVYQK
jgi:GNAT superfamily N-acetyltransferase